MPTTLFTINTTRRPDGTVVLTPTGDLDLATCDQFERRVGELIAEGGHTITLDLSDLDFVDSTGVSVLVTLRAQLRNRGGNLSASQPRPAVAKVFEVTGLDHLLLGISAESEPPP